MKSIKCLTFFAPYNFGYKIGNLLYKKKLIIKKGYQMAAFLQNIVLKN